MNEDYENEENNEEEQEQEENEGYDYSSLDYDRPPTTNNPFLNIKNKTRKATSDVGKRAFSAFLNALKGVLTFLVSNPIVLLIAIIAFVAIALIWLVITKSTSDKVVTSVGDYISSSDTIDETAKGLYESRHSLMLVKLSEINEMYDKFIKDKTVPGNIKTAMKTKVGKNDVEKKKAKAANDTSVGETGNVQTGVNGEGVATLGGPYDPADNQVLTKSAGRVNFEGHTETYYSQRVLPGGGLDIPGRHVASDGTIRDENNYVCVASDDLPKGTLINTSLGMGKVYDCGSTHNNIDIYTDW